jgi:hypothetical protein
MHRLVEGRTGRASLHFADVFLSRNAFADSGHAMATFFVANLFIKCHVFGGVEFGAVVPKLKTECCITSLSGMRQAFSALHLVAFLYKYCCQTVIYRDEIVGVLYDYCV